MIPYALYFVKLLRKSLIFLRETVIAIQRLFRYNGIIEKPYGEREDL